MWTKHSQNQPQPQNQNEMPPAPSVPRTPGQASEPAAFYSAPSRPSTLTPRSLACVGATLEIKGTISGEEDLQIDGRVEGPVSLHGHRLIVGRSGQVNSEINARELMIYGRVTGHLRASDRVEIKKDAEVTGDLATGRISIEDGAIFKGHIEIQRQEPRSEPPRELKAPVRAAMEPESEDVFVPSEVN
jgi:cytoskeletal protein CcmA (bactofilin family)